MALSPGYGYNAGESNAEAENSLPRKYHRPPAVKRRKSRKTTVPYIVDEPLPPEDGGTPAYTSSESVGTAELPAQFQAGPTVSLAEDRGATSQRARAGSRYINRDYSYVRREIVRIAGVAGFLIVSLIITAILR